MRNRVLLSVLAFLALLAPQAAHAQEAQPGDACAVANTYRVSGGPETTGKGFTMTCQGGVWVRVTESDTAGNLGVRQAAPQAPLHVGGEAIIGPTTGLACNAGRAGGLRWSSANATIEMCDGSAWKRIAASVCDGAPAFFPFTDQSSLAASSQYSSNIVQITGMEAGCVASVGVSGQGTPEYRVCSTSNCSSVVQNWTNANNNIAMQGLYLQLRASTAASAGVTHTITASIGPVSSDWKITTTPADCSTGPIGTVCADGTVYAGTSPDGNVPMYTTRCIAGKTWSGSACTGAVGTYSWNDGGTSYVDTPLVNCSSAGGCDAAGESNTALLALVDANYSVGGVQSHAAATYCANLTLHGQSDWYLPSVPEFEVVNTNRVDIGNLDDGYYTVASETNSGFSWRRYTLGGSADNQVKDYTYAVRCVRRDADVTPDAFGFTDLTGQVAASLVNSSIVQITGLSIPARIYIVSSSRLAEYRICNDAACTSVIVGWTSTGTQTISNNQYIQVRTYTSGDANGVSAVTVLVGTVTDTWNVTAAGGDPCSGTPNPGAVCSDGTVYAGTTPDGGVPMYVTRCDLNQNWNGSDCTGSRVGYPWNNGNGSFWVDTSLVGCGSPPSCAPTGESNTTTLAAADSDSNTAGVQPHAAAKACDDLVVNGYSDWYLPSIMELNVIYDGRGGIGRFAESSYWSSSEGLSGHEAGLQDFQTGNQSMSSPWKGTSLFVRCARK